MNYQNIKLCDLLYYVYVITQIKQIGGRIRIMTTMVRTMLVTISTTFLHWVYFMLPLF